MNDSFVLMAGGRPGKSAHALRLAQALDPEWVQRHTIPRPDDRHPWLRFWFPMPSESPLVGITFDMVSFVEEARRVAALRNVLGAGR